jgi:hypothetical protein
MKTPRFTLSAVVAVGLFAASAGVAHAKCEIVDGFLTGKSEGGTWNSDCITDRDARAARQTAADARVTAQVQQQSAPTAIDAAPVQQSAAPAPSAQPRPQQQAAAPAASAQPSAGGNANLPPQLPPGFQPGGGGSSGGNAHARRAKAFFNGIPKYVFFPSSNVRDIVHFSLTLATVVPIYSGAPYKAALIPELQLSVRGVRAWNWYGFVRLGWVNPLVTDKDSDGYTVTNQVLDAVFNGQKPTQSMIDGARQERQTKGMTDPLRTNDAEISFGTEARMFCWGGACRRWNGLVLQSALYVRALSVDVGVDFRIGSGVRHILGPLGFEFGAILRFPFSGPEKGLLDQVNAQTTAAGLSNPIGIISAAGGYFKFSY